MTYENLNKTNKNSEKLFFTSTAVSKMQFRNVILWKSFLLLDTENWRDIFVPTKPHLSDGIVIMEETWWKFEKQDYNESLYDQNEVPNTRWLKHSFVNLLLFSAFLWLANLFVSRQLRKSLKNQIVQFLFVACRF